MASQLDEIAKGASWETHPGRTLGAARSIYLRMTAEQKLWLRGREFVGADRDALGAALRQDVDVDTLTPGLPIDHRDR